MHVNHHDMPAERIARPRNRSLAELQADAVALAETLSWARGAARRLLTEAKALPGAHAFASLTERDRYLLADFAEPSLVADLDLLLLDLDDETFAETLADLRRSAAAEPFPVRGAR